MAVAFAIIQSSEKNPTFAVLFYPRPVAMNQSHKPLATKDAFLVQVVYCLSYPSTAKAAAVAAFNPASQNHYILELERTLVVF